MTKSRRILLLALLAAMVAVAGCSGVPFLTMWHFRNFGPKDLLRTDPALIRAALQLENGVDIKGKTAKLNIRIKFANESPQKYSLPLTLLKEGPSLGAGIGKGEPGKHWYLFALSPAGIRAFRDLQQVLARHLDASGHLEEHGKASLSVQTGDLDFSDAARQRMQKAGKMFLQIRLELSPEDGFYTLYKGGLPFSKSKDNDQDSD